MKSEVRISQTALKHVYPKRMFARFLTVFVIALILLSSGFLITESDHDCPGEGCHVCEQLALCEAVLECVAFAAALFLAGAAARRVFLRAAAASYPAAPAFCRRVPLFSDSVRLNL
jgi:hypothetical protein